MPDFAWFGYPALESSILAWGTGAIFHRSDKFPLDILWDRQGHKFDRDTQKDAYREFANFINQTVLPKLQELAHCFDPSDDDKLVWHFDWPGNPNLLVVAMGSPNRSYGYFYLSVNLVPTEAARSGAAERIQDTDCHSNGEVEATAEGAETLTPGSADTGEKEE